MSDGDSWPESVLIFKNPKKPLIRKTDIRTNRFNDSSLDSWSRSLLEDV